MMKKIGERIRRIRVMKDYTQSNVAEDLGMTTGAYAKIERGETDANVSRLLQIAQILEVHVCDFFEDSRSASAGRESKGASGEYASRTEVDQLSKSIQTLLREIEKMKLELQENPKKKGKKK
jgi:transcriptional regulator with XRE-family HTH domain